jgi:hypothetical protein
MSCAPPSGWAVAEWTVDAGPLVMGARVRGFSRPGPLFRSLLNIIPGGRSFPPRPSFLGAHDQWRGERKGVFNKKWDWRPFLAQFSTFGGANVLMGAKL